MSQGQNQRNRNSQSDQRKHHKERIRTQSKNKQRPEARENASELVAIGFNLRLIGGASGANFLGQSQNKVMHTDRM